jgi:hypothetical protein
MALEAQAARHAPAPLLEALAARLGRPVADVAADLEARVHEIEALRARYGERGMLETLAARLGCTPAALEQRARELEAEGW